LNPAIAVSVAASTKLSKALDFGKPGIKEDNVVYATVSCSKATTAICMKKRSIVLVVVGHNSCIFVAFAKYQALCQAGLRLMFFCYCNSNWRRQATHRSTSTMKERSQAGVGAG
jgi:hypothetical protein